MRPPSNGTITSRYGRRTNPVTGAQETHHGLDLNASAGTTLVFPEAGTLTHYGTVPGWGVHGLVAIIRGASGIEHWLSHTDRALVPVGTEGDEGDDVAVMGLTGQTTGLHVHWETRRNGVRLNPEDVLAESASSGKPTPHPTEQEYETMFIAITKGGTFWLCEPGKKAHKLGQDSGARQSGIPILNYPGDWELQQLQQSRPEIK